MDVWSRCITYVGDRVTLVVLSVSEAAAAAEHGSAIREGSRSWGYDRRASLSFDSRQPFSGGLDMEPENCCLETERRSEQKGWRALPDSRPVFCSDRVLTSGQEGKWWSCVT